MSLFAMIISAALSSASAVGGVVASSNMAKEEKETSEIRVAAQKAEAREATKESYKEALAKRARMRQAATNQGVSQSSAAKAANSNLSSNLASFNSQQSANTQRAQVLSKSNQRLADVQSNKDAFNSLGQLGSSVMNAAFKKAKK